MNTKGLKVKANIKKHFVCVGVILLCYVYLLTHEISDAEIYGFWAGLWQGGIFLKNSAKICRIAKNERFTSVSPQ